MKISTSEVIQVVSPRKEEDENEENSNSINEEVIVNKSSRCFPKFILIK